MKIRVLYLILWRAFGKPIFYLSPVHFFKFRIFIIKIFGGKVDWSALIYPSTDIYSPKNLIMASNSCLSYKTIIYNVAPIKIGKNSCISQFSFLCTASHNIDSHNIESGFMELKTAPICIGDNVWIGADCYINLGCKIMNNAVIAARSTLFKDVNENEVVSSTTVHKLIKKRKPPKKFI